MHILCLLYIGDLYRGAWFRVFRHNSGALSPSRPASPPRERAGEVYSNIPCLFAPLLTRQRLAVSFIFRVPILRSIPGYPNAVRRLQTGVSQRRCVQISTLFLAGQSRILIVRHWFDYDLKRIGVVASRSPE